MAGAERGEALTLSLSVAVRNDLCRFARIRGTIPQASVSY
jgi:hypothetical protein